MVQTAIGYLLFHAYSHFITFLRHSYVKSARMYMNFILNKLAALDTFFALRITITHLFEPLYGDYSFLGYVLGFFFRVMRCVVGGIVYSVILVCALFGYLLWVLAPLYALARIFLG